MKYITIILFLLFSVNSQATQFIWNGLGDGTSWENGNNWVDGVAPGTNTTEDVIINGATSIKITTNVVVGRLRVNNSNLTIENTGIFRIGNTAPPSVDTLYAGQIINSTIILKGQMYMETLENDYALAIKNSLFEVRNGAYFQIIYSDFGVFLDNGGIFKIKPGGLAEIIVDNTAIFNKFKIQNEGKLILNYGIDGLLNDGIIANSDSLILNGVGLTAQRGIVSTDSVNNAGFLDINGNNLFGIHNTGSIVNTFTGYLEVYKYSTSAALTGSKGIYNNGLFQNNGEVYVNARNEFGISNEENPQGYINNGTTSISKPDSYAFKNEGTILKPSLFTNDGKFSFAQGIKLGLLNNPFSNILWNGKGLMTGSVVIQNEGKITISDSMKLQATGTALLNTGKVNINGPLDIFQSYQGIENQDSVIVNSAGSISTTYISVAIPRLYSIKNSGYFANDGSIDISQGAFGIINENSTKGFFNNNEIEISGVGDIFITNNGTGVDSSQFINNGNINLHTDGSPDGTKGIGIKNLGKAKFISVGEIKMSDFFAAFDNVLNESYFRNEGIFDFKETRGININNTGTFESTSSSSALFQCDENFDDYSILNNGTIILGGETELNYTDTYQRNPSLIQNNSIFTNKSKISIAGNVKTGAITNTGTFANQDSIIAHELYNIGILNSGIFINEAFAYIEIDSFKLNAEAIIVPGSIFSNSGTVLVKSGHLALSIKSGETFSNAGKLIIKECIGEVITISGTNSKFHNMPNSITEINNIEASLNVNPAVIFLEVGQLHNQGQMIISETIDPGIRVLSGELINDDTLSFSGVSGPHSFVIENGLLTNNGSILLNGAGEENLTLMNLFAPASYYNNGIVEITDAYQKGVLHYGTFTTTNSSQFIFTNNTRNSFSLLSHSNATPVVYNGSIKANNSQNCVTLSGAAINNGFLDLRTCSIAMTGGTNSTLGHILSKDVSIIGINNGILEHFSDQLYTLNGVNLITNNGLIIDHGDSYRNIKFNDGDALGFPIWNKGLFISPFYGTLSNGIKETVNLNYTQNGSLPLSTTWFTDRAKTSAAGTWHQTEHHFIPNSVANLADSLFLEVTMTGSSPITLSIPHLTPSTCPYPIITKTTRPVVIKNWNDHTTWRGNRAPDYCQKVILGSNNNMNIYSGFKAKVNFIDYKPETGAGRYLNIESGSVMEINALPYN